jgi:hypothetical protein
MMSRALHDFGPSQCLGHGVSKVLWYSAFEQSMKPVLPAVLTVVIGTQMKGNMGIGQVMTQISRCS